MHSDEPSQGPPLSRGEHWLLETAVHAAIPLRVLNSPDLEIAFNKRGHGLSPTAIASTLHALASRGDIETIDDHHEDALVTVSAAEIERELADPDGERRYYYRLTPPGGARWEHASRADWGRFVRHNWSTQEDRLLVAANALFLRRFAEIFRETLAEDGMSIVDERWDVVQPWKATRWKILPQGTSLRIRSTKSGARAKKRTARLRLQPLMIWYESPFTSRSL